MLGFLKRHAIKDITKLATNTEHFAISLFLRASSINEQQKKDIERLLTHDFLDGDTCTITHDLFIHYFGKEYEILSVIENLLDVAEVIDVDTLELTKGKCLIQDVLCKLENIEQKYRGLTQWRVNGRCI